MSHFQVVAEVFYGQHNFRPLISWLKGNSTGFTHDDQFTHYKQYFASHFKLMEKEFLSSWTIMEVQS